MIRCSPVPIKRHGDIADANPPARYARREPERTVLYQVFKDFKDHLRTFLAEARERSEHGFGLPRFVERELERYLECGRAGVPHGPLRRGEDSRSPRAPVTSPARGPGSCFAPGGGCLVAQLHP